MLKYWNILFWDYTYFSPHYLWLILFAPILFFLLRKARRKQTGNLKFTGLPSEQQQLKHQWIHYFFQIRTVLFTFVYVLIVVALAKPYHFQIAAESQPDYKNGIDIVLAIDVSFSMYAQDFNPNRLEAAKKVAIAFVEDRPSDRIGLVAFA
jgi:Ca-activated chloride channel family protein